MTRLLTTKELNRYMKLHVITSPSRTAEAFNIENIIDPGDTRPIMCHFIETAQQVVETRLGPGSKPTYRP